MSAGRNRSIENWWMFVCRVQSYFNDKTTNVGWTCTFFCFISFLRSWTINKNWNNEKRKNPEWHLVICDDMIPGWDSFFTTEEPKGEVTGTTREQLKCHPHPPPLLPQCVYRKCADIILVIPARPATACLTSEEQPGRFSICSSETAQHKQDWHGRKQPDVSQLTRGHDDSFVSELWSFRV